MAPVRLPHCFPLQLCAAFCLLLALLLSGGLAAANTAEKKAVPAAAEHAAQSEYQKAADQCHLLLRNPASAQRQDWLKNIQELERIYQKHPQHRVAPACLHLAARMRHVMHQRFKQPADMDQAVAQFSNVVSLFPKSQEAAESLFALAQIEQTNGNLRGAAKTYYKLLQSYPHSSRRTQAEEQLRQLTIIAESLAARKEGRQFRPPAAKLTPPKPVIAAAHPPAAALAKKPEPPKAAALVPAAEKKPQERMILPPPVFKPAEPPKTVVQSAPLADRQSRPVFSAPQPAPAPPPAPPKIVISSPKIEAAPSAPAAKKPQEKMTLPLPDFTPAPPVAVKVKEIRTEPPQAVQPAPSPKPQPEQQKQPAAKPEPPKVAEEEGGTIFGKISLPFFGQKEKEADKPAAPVVEKKPEPPKEAAPPPKPAEPSAKIVVSDLKIAVLEPTQPVPAPAPPPEIKPEPPKLAEPAPAPAPEKKAEAAPPPKPPEPAPKKEPEQPALAELLPIQHWSSENYSRVAVSVSAPVVYHAKLPEKDGRTLRLEFKKSHVAPELRLPVIVASGLIKHIQAEQADSETVRVLVELNDVADCKIFSLNDPFRVVFDLRGSQREETGAAAASAAENSRKEQLTEKERKEKAESVRKKIAVKVKPAATEKHELTLAQQLGLSIRRIMIDPGHGGKDSGATGFGLQEKDIVLDVSKRVRDILQKEHYEVLMTRDKDMFIPLEERTALANTKGADLFLSVHVNAHPKQWVKGVETFYLNLAANPEAMRVAALENATSSRSMSEMEDILSGLMQNSKIDESSLLAEFIQTSMAEGLRQYKIKDLGVKKAPFYVLIGAQMPAVLAEISFISNKDEAELLRNDQYLEAIAEQIAVGVIAYIEHRRTAAAPLSSSLSM
uniref:N-acetylmuramoyl-L-alanine amidase n=1 Tax=Candidatus Electronema sp. TaxID=2698783 RepID=UPI004056FFD7